MAMHAGWAGSRVAVLLQGSNWGAGTRTPISGTKTRRRCQLDDPPRGRWMVPGGESTNANWASARGLLSGTHANIRSCHVIRNKKPERRSHRPCAIRRHFASWGFGRPAGTTVSFGRMWTRSGVSQPITSIRTACGSQSSCETNLFRSSRFWFQAQITAAASSRNGSTAPV